MPKQRYVSPELTHFVGKTKSTDDERYSLLVNNILKEGCLKFPPVDDRRCIEGLSGSPLALVGGTLPPGDDTEAAYSQRICFCDIPVTDLEIHMSKYSRFGLSFLKRFLRDKGANPVLYVAKNSQALAFGLEGVRSGYEVWSRDKVFKGNIQEFEKLRQMLPEPQKYFLDLLVFAFIKYFDDSASDEAEANVYMEREWRVIGDVKFALPDVHRVFMPERYAERFREDLPDYKGQLSFSDHI